MKLFLTYLFLFITLISTSQDLPLSYYLPNIKYDQNIPSPEKFFGHQIGQWHLSHDQIIYYLRELSEKSDRIIFHEYARSHENRPLISLIITSPENLKNIEKIKRDHLALTDPTLSKDLNIDDLPIIIYQGYSIHGNEASGANASLLNAYYLAAGQSKEIIELLQNAIILLDPSFNPDGVQRFSTWVNMHKNKSLTSDSYDREYNEAWPGGRTNHYWFDLNRDWISVTHPESKGRIKFFHEWKPDILTDHHEMGTNSTFFFQPGVPERTNPQTPLKNQLLTEAIARFHIESLDQIKSLYFSKSNYDDFFYGKGSAYPDINGGIGILFEQASARGHLQRSENGELSFPFAIRNQVVTSISTQKAGLNLRKEILTYKKQFFVAAMKESKNDKTKGYLISDRDLTKLDKFLEILRIHKIDVYSINEEINIGNQKFSTENSFYIPLEQIQNRFIKSLFETVSEFKDSIFYDVSTWTMPLAFDLRYTPVENRIKNKIAVGTIVNSSIINPGKFINKGDPYAYIFEWTNYNSPTALYKIMNSGLRTKTLTKPLKIISGNINKDFEKGSIIIPIQNQNYSSEEIEKFMDNLARHYHIDFYGLGSGYGDNDISLGHPSVESLVTPKILLVIGQGARSYNAGELWHHIDTKLEIPITKIESENLSFPAMQKYNTMILPSGNYRFNDTQKKSIEEWIKNGGNLILVSGSVGWAARNKIITLDQIKNKVSPVIKSTYEKAAQDQGSRVLGGAIFATEGDLSHPLLYGYQDSEIPVFRRSSTFFKPPKNIYASPLKYTDNPRMSGYTPRGTEEQAKGAVALSIHSKGRGKVIAIHDNPVFRGYWWGGNRLLNNAIFFGPIISSRTTASED